MTRSESSFHRPAISTVFLRAVSAAAFGKEAASICRLDQLHNRGQCRHMNGGEYETGHHPCNPGPRTVVD